MTYNFHGSWNKYLGFNAPLYGPSGDMFTVDYGVNYWLSKGAEVGKLNLGLANYRRSFVMGSSSEPNSAAGEGGAAGRVIFNLLKNFISFKITIISFKFKIQFIGTTGFLSYYEICEKISQDGWSEKYSELYKVPYAHSNSEWVGYDDASSLKLKVCINLSLLFQVHQFQVNLYLRHNMQWIKD